MDKEDMKFALVTMLIVAVSVVSFALILVFAPISDGVLDYDRIIGAVAVVVTVVAFAFSLVLLMAGLKTLSTERKITTLLNSVEKTIKELKNKEMSLSYAIDVGTISCETTVELTEIIRDQITGIVESSDDEGDEDTKKIMMRLHLLRQLGIATSSERDVSKIRAVREIIGGIGSNPGSEHEEYFAKRSLLICEELLKKYADLDKNQMSQDEQVMKKDVVALYAYATNKFGS